MTSNRRIFNGSGMVEMGDFGGVKTLGGGRGKMGVAKGDDLFPVSSAFYGTMGANATPLVKQKTNLGEESPRVQMFRTRVIYSDVKDNIGGGMVNNRAQEASV